MTDTTFPTRAQMRDVVERYLAAVADGTPDQIADLYAPDATVEDPAGSSPHVGRAAITDFYRPLAVLTRRTHLRDFHAAGDMAVFGFDVDVLVPGRCITTSPVDVMTFDAEGRITSMRAVWSNEDLRIVENEQNEQNEQDEGAQ
ncbi:nuclear transport factor 2 family protein [Microbacterium sp. zg-Y818]|uniref:nuclear transport factor 2 family protein n=1 Tax=unclassified Microbacterium TaxID=2609290 RepID=UPI00214C3A9B|nr:MULTISPECIES: nuclear transport factor 2 family protein [unclassified Microbacterium]MCR2799362.1 nuclear transport factor 2 family protein [Microbacterium sp. zg.Y818]WIM21361.1 nuclear transport factor 2 family protein [Microbacterium sp. zg-Y818]